MRVFLDTNVLAGAVATRGLCAELFGSVLAEHELIISQDFQVELLGLIPRWIHAPRSDSNPIGQC